MDVPHRPGRCDTAVATPLTVHVELDRAARPARQTPRRPPGQPPVSPCPRGRPRRVRDTVHGCTLRHVCPQGLAWLRLLITGHRFTYDQAHAVNVHLTKAGLRYALHHGAKAARRRAVIVTCGFRKAPRRPPTWASQWPLTLACCGVAGQDLARWRSTTVAALDNRVTAPNRAGCAIHKYPWPDASRMQQGHICQTQGITPGPT